RIGGEVEDAVGLLVLTGGAELFGVAAEEVVDVEEGLGVEVLEFDFGAFAEAALDRPPVDAEGVVADVDASAGHTRTRPGAHGALALEDRDPAAQHRLADAVLGAALDAEVDAVGVEGAKPLAGDRAAVELETRQGVAFVSGRAAVEDPPARQRAGQLGAEHA